MQIGRVGERGERTERKKGEVGGELEGEIDRGRAVSYTHLTLPTTAEV